MSTASARPWKPGTAALQDLGADPDAYRQPGSAQGPVEVRPPQPRTPDQIAGSDMRPGFDRQTFRPQATDPGGTNSGGFMKVADYPNAPRVPSPDHPAATDHGLDSGPWRQV